MIIKATKSTEVKTPSADGELREQAMILQPRTSQTVQNSGSSFSFASLNKRRNKIQVGPYFKNVVF